MKLREILNESMSDKEIKSWFIDTVDYVSYQPTDAVYALKDDDNGEPDEEMCDVIEVKNGKLTFKDRIDTVYVNNGKKVSSWPLSSTAWPKLYELLLDGTTLDDWNKLPGNIKVLRFYRNCEIVAANVNVPAMSKVETIAFGHKIEMKNPLALLKLPSLKEIDVGQNEAGKKTPFVRACGIIDESLKNGRDLAETIEALHDEGLEEYAKL